MMIHKIYYWLLLAACLTGLSACNEECAHLQFTGNDRTIVEFALTDGVRTYPLSIYADSVVVPEDIEADLATCRAIVKVSEGATLSPDPETVTDWTEGREFTVTAADGKSQHSYRYVVHKVSAEKRCEELVMLTTQEEVNRFGAEGYKVVSSLTIHSVTDEDCRIIDLSPLKGIEEIEYNLQVKDFYGKNLGGLEHLKRITTFSMVNDTIESVVFHELEEITNFMIGALQDEYGTGFCDKLTEVSCPKLGVVKNNFVCYARTEDCSGFSALQEVGGQMYVNTSSLRGLEKLYRVKYMDIRGNLTSLAPLANLKVVNSLELSMCQSLTSLEGLNLEVVGDLNINNCPRISDIKALSTLTELKSLFLSGIRDLESLEGLHNLRMVEGNLTLMFIGGNSWGYPPVKTGISNLDALARLEAVGGNITLRQCYNLSDYCALSVLLQTYSGQLTINGNAYNPTLEDILEGKCSKQINGKSL